MNKPTKEQALEAVRVLLNYIDSNPDREALKRTPERVVKSYSELFSGYDVDIKKMLSRKFQDISDYNDVVMLRDINFSSTCEHHMLPFRGKVDIAYIPNGSVVGVSKLVRLVDAFAKRLQIQEKMTAEIAESLQSHLTPRGVAIRVNAEHMCMCSRGVKREDSILSSMHFTGEYKKDSKRQEFISLLK